MKNDRLKQELNRELRSVRVSGKLKQQILADAAASRAPRKRRNRAFSPLYAAAALVLVVCLTVGVAALRREIPDLSATTLSAGAGKGDSKTVWICDRDGSYHADVDCCGSSGAHSVRVEEARAEGRKGCCLCIDEGDAVGEDLVWMTLGGDYYHQDKSCSGMTDSMGVLEIEALMFGRYACPECMNGTIHLPQLTMEPYPMPVPTPMPTDMVLIQLQDGEINSMVSAPEYNAESEVDPLATIPPMATVTPIPMTTAEPTPPPMDADAMPTAAPTVEVLATEEPAANAAPTPMATVEPIPMSLNDEPMPTPAPAVDVLTTEEPTVAPTVDADAAELVWIASGDRNYHADAHCSGMEGAWQTPVKTAILTDYIPCDVCMERTIWKTEGGAHWHRAKNCSGMENAQEIVLFPGETPASEACQTCLEGGFPVWVTDYGTLYHWEEHCSGMKGAKQIMQSEASGLPCPICLPNLDPGTSPVTYEVSLEEAEQMMVWFNKGIYYHSDEHCSGLEDAQSASEAEVLSYGKAPCMQCLPGRGTPHVEYAVMDGPVEAFETKAATDYAAYGADGEADDRNLVWLAEDGVYYHADKHCSGMENAEGRTLMEALEAGSMPCPLCSKQLEPVWAVENAEYFHLLEYCSGMTDAKRMTGSEAVEQGMKLCPVCWEEMRLLILAAGA